MAKKKKPNKTKPSSESKAGSGELEIHELDQVAGGATRGATVPVQLPDANNVGLGYGASSAGLGYGGKLGGVGGMGGDGGG